jgi:hypothetical protein
MLTTLLRAAEQQVARAIAEQPGLRAGVLSAILQMWITGGRNPVSPSQGRRFTELAVQYGVTTTDPIPSPMEPGLRLVPARQPAPELGFQSLLRALQWLTRNTRPDIMFAVTYLSHFCTTYSHVHFGTLKRVLRYPYHTRSQPLTLSCLPSESPLQVRLFTDSDWAACKNSGRSVSGNPVTVGSAPVSWQSKRQATVALSTCESEYMGLGDGAKEGLYVLQFFSQFVEVQRPAPLFHDNQGADVFTKQLKQPLFDRLRMAIMSAPPSEG